MERANRVRCQVTWVWAAAEGDGKYAKENRHSCAVILSAMQLLSLSTYQSGQITVLLSLFWCKCRLERPS